MQVIKSSRHQKIIGNFGENLICNWLSRSGFEVAVVDHTGLDLIAYNPSTSLRIGVTVKSRTRTAGTEQTSVTVFQSRNRDRQKLLDACEAFACEPWIAIYVETEDSADVFLTSLDNYDTTYCPQQQRAVDSWKMREKDQVLYAKDPRVKHIRISFNGSSWNWEP